MPYLPVLKQRPLYKISSIEGILRAWENEIMATLAKRHSIRCCLFLSVEVLNVPLGGGEVLMPRS